MKMKFNSQDYFFLKIIEDIVRLDKNEISFSRLFFLKNDWSDGVSDLTTEFNLWRWNDVKLKQNENKICKTWMVLIRIMSNNFLPLKETS